MALVQVRFAHPWTNPDSGTAYSVGQLASVDEDLAKTLIFNALASYVTGNPTVLIPPGTVDDVELAQVLAGFEKKVPRDAASPGYVVSLAQDGVSLVLTPAPEGGGGSVTVTAPPATGSVRGTIMLKGDLGGTADNPTVPALGSKLDLEQVQDAVAAMIVAGSNVTKVYDDVTGTLTISATGGGTGTGTTDPEIVRDTIASALRAGDGITITVDDTANTITVSSPPDDGGPTNSLTEAERVRAVVGAALRPGANVTIAVDEEADSITISSTGGGTSGTSPSIIDGGTPTSTYLTEADEAEVIRDVISTALVAGAGMTIAVDDTSNRITLTSTGSTSPTIVRDVVAAALVAGPGVDIDVSPDGLQFTISAPVDPAQLEIALRSNLVAGSGILFETLDNRLVITATGGGTGGGGGGVDASQVRDIIGQALTSDGTITITPVADTFVLDTTATENSPDDYLLNRQNHTGLQSIGSIDGLDAYIKGLLNAPGSPMNPHTSATVTRNPDFTVNYWSTWPVTPAGAAPQDQLFVPADGATGPTTRYLQPFAGTAGSWTNDGSTATVAYSTDRFTSSPGSLKLTTTAGAGSPARATSPRFAVAPGDSLTVTARVGSTLADRTVALQYRLYNASNTQVAFGSAAAVGVSTSIIASSATFTSLTWTIAVPQDPAITQIDLQVIINGIFASGEIYYIDDVTAG